ncbi:MAG TPA: patatin family protein, partial [Alphaproteobacteria bacterium]|nr:patatin family protein [Alphaproteobacteria bacterium]
MKTKQQTALILEGGAMRGLYSAGVLDVLMKNKIGFDVVYGVSAGALFGLNYKSRQIGRVLRYNLKYANNKNYMGLYSLITTGNIMNKDFCFKKLVYEL